MRTPMEKLFSIQIVHAIEFLVTLQNRRNFLRFSLGRTDAQGGCKGHVTRAEKKVTIFEYVLQGVIKL